LSQIAQKYPRPKNIPLINLPIVPLPLFAKKRNSFPPLKKEEEGGF
jgi:hypothetical protein